MSNSALKMTKSQLVLIARELVELTGETESQLLKWAGQHPATRVKLPTRETFKTWLSEGGWKRSTSKTLTKDCRLLSRPLSCRLRLRVISWVAGFKRDVARKVQRQMVLLMGYEACSGLLNVRLYRGTDYAIGDPILSDSPKVPVSTVASFVEECSQMVGLPIQRISLTQQLFPWPAMGQGDRAYLSLSEKRLVVKPPAKEPGDSELLCGFAVDPPCEPSSLVMSPTLPVFAEWFESSNAPELMRHLSESVNRHNALNALPRLGKAREKLDALIKASKEGRRGFRRPESRFKSRLQRHEYLRGTKSLNEVRNCWREYLDFDDVPGDRGR